MDLVFDIGGTTTRLALAENKQLVGEPVTFPTPQNFSEAVATLESSAKQLLNGQLPAKVAGGIAGPFNSDKSTLVSAPNLPDWIGKPIKSEFERIFQTSVILENDTALGGLGEATVGAGKDFSIVAYLAVGTGVGGCRIVNKQIDQNAQGFEPGHQIVAQNERNTFTLEQLISGAALKNRYNLAEGEQPSETLVDELAWQLAVGLHNLTLIWSPEVIILGGGVINSGVIPLPQVQAYMQNMMQTFAEIPQLLPSQLQDKAGLFGAATIL